MATYQFNYEKELTDKLDNFGSKEFSEKEIFEMTLWKLSRVPHVNHDTLKKLNSLAFIKDIDSVIANIINVLINTDITADTVFLLIPPVTNNDNTLNKIEANTHTNIYK